jgi:predicted Zn-dependent protease
MTPVERSPRDLENLLATSRRHGAQHAEIVCEAAVTRSASGANGGRRGNHGAVSSTETDVAHATAWLPDGRVGRASRAIHHLGEVDTLLAEAVERARSAAGPSPDPQDAPPVERLEAVHRPLDIDDRRHAQITAEEIAEALADNHAAAVRAAPAGRAEVSAPTLELRREQVVFASTRGVLGGYHHTTYRASARATLASPGRPPITFTESIASRSFATVATLPWGHTLGLRAADLADEAPWSGGPVRVLLPPRAAARVLDWLAESVARESCAPGTTWLSQRPDVSLHRKLHLTDDGTTLGGLRSAPFDARGVPPSRVVLLREGVPHERYVAAGGAHPTGHQRPWAADGAPWLRPSHLAVHAGLRSVAALRAEMNRPILHIDDFAPGVLASWDTGALAQTVHGVLWDGTRRLGGCAHLRLTGDLLDALRQLAAVSSETDRIHHVDAPALVLDGLQATPHAP